MKKEKLSSLSLNKSVISKLNNPGSLKGGSPTFRLCPLSNDTCIGGFDPECELGSDACFSDLCVTAEFACNFR